MEISRKFLIFLRATSILLNFFINQQKSWIIYSILIALLFIQIIEVLWLLKTNSQSYEDQNQYLTIILITPLIIELQIQLGFKGVDIIGTLFLESLFFLNYRKNTNGNHFRAFYLIPSFLAIRLIIILKESQNFTILVQIYLIVLPFISEIKSLFLPNYNVYQQKLNTEEKQTKRESRQLSPCISKREQDKENIISNFIEIEQIPISRANAESQINQNPKQTYGINSQPNSSPGSKYSTLTNTFFKKILNLLPYGCIVLNVQSEVIYSNVKLLKLLQTTNEEDILKKVSKLIKGSKMDQKKKQQQSFLFNDNITPKSKNDNNQSNLDVFLNVEQFHELKKGEDNKCIESLVQKSQQISMSQSNCENYQENAKLSSFLNLSYKTKDSKGGLQNFKIKVYSNLQGSGQSQNLFTLIIVKNVSKKKELGKLKKQYKFQNQLLESFSHELRTPLNCSIQSIQAVIQIGVSRNLESLLNQALGSNFLLLHQINDILDTAAIETQNFQYNWSYFSIQEIINEINTIYSESIKIKNITLKTNTSIQDLYTKIKSDKARILQILLNLMNNSIKFTRQGGTIQLSTEIIHQSDYTKYVKFELWDNGIGIDQGKLQQINTTLIFQNSKIKNSDSNEFLGLGLTICGKLAEGLTTQFENNLVVNSDREQGTAVSFYADDHQSSYQSSNYISYKSSAMLKSVCEKLTYSSKCLDKNQGQAPQNITQTKDYEEQMKIKIPQIDLCFEKVNHQKQDINTIMNKYLGIKKKAPERVCKLCTQILIVDDVPFNHIALKAMLSACYLQSDSAYDGMQALDLVKKRLSNHCQTYRLIMMDIEMPKWDGFQTTSKIRQFLSSQEKQFISNIIMCSAYDSADNVEKAKVSGMTGFLFKPVKAENLKRILQKYHLY